MTRSPLLLGLPLALGLSSPACRKAADEGAPAPSAAPSASAPPVDRLAKGELAPGAETVAGLVLPRGMRVAARFPRVTHASGAIPPEDVANYVRERVEVRRTELGAVGTLFPRVRIRGGDPARLYDIAIRPIEGGSELAVEDVTPVPRPPQDPSLSEEERWRRAGFKPDGTPLDVKNLR